jgi:hypothetical protein
VRIVVGKLLHANAHYPAHYGTQTETGDKKAARRLEAKCEDGRHQLEHESQNEEPHGFVHPWTRCCYFNGRIYVGEVAVVVAAIKYT